MIKVLLAFFALLIFTGCAPQKESVQTFFQTDSATSIKKDYAFSIAALKKLKVKLDKRNPKAYDKTLVKSINSLLMNLDNNLHLNFQGQKVTSYKDYLQLAFTKDNIDNRNDYLILGLYYLMFDAYDIDEGHQITALSYNTEKLEKLHKNLQIIKWKLKYAKDINLNYLFLTWQNNWQIELEKKIKQGYNPSWKELQGLAYIKNGKESFFAASNFSFEVLLTQMIDRVGGTLVVLGITPEEMTLEALKTIFIFI